MLVRRIVGVSMLPNFHPGAIVLGLRHRRPKIGDVIIARHRDLEIIKRVKQIDDRGYFLLGDNPAESSDSRTYGWFDHQAIKAVVVGRLTR